MASAFTGTGKMFPGICRTPLLCIYKRQKENHKEMKSLVFRTGSEQCRHPLLGNVSVELPAQLVTQTCPCVTQSPCLDVPAPRGHTKL